MKKILFFLIVVFTTVASLAQTGVYRPFPTDSVLWSYRNYSTIFGFYETFAYKLKGDTSVNSVSYYKLYRIDKFTYENDSGDALHALIRVDNSLSKVWLRYTNYSLFRDTTEFLLYDFSLQINDTFYAKTVNLDSIGFNVDTLIVQRRDSVYTQQGYLPQIILKKKSGFKDLFNFVQRIGSTEFLLYQEKYLAYFTLGLSLTQEISCFQLNDINYFPPVNCIFNVIPNSIKESFKSSLIKVYPTFFQSGQPIRFKLKNESELPLESITISNAGGEQVEHLVLMHNQEEMIAQKQYAQGIYIVNLKYKNGLNEYLKIVIF